MDAYLRTMDTLRRRALERGISEEDLVTYITNHVTFPDEQIVNQLAAVLIAKGLTDVESIPKIGEYKVQGLLVNSPVVEVTLIPKENHFQVTLSGTHVNRPIPISSPLLPFYSDSNSKLTMGEIVAWLDTEIDRLEFDWMNLYEDRADVREAYSARFTNGN